MTDLSQLSDADLLKALGAPGGGQPPLSAMSNDELMAALGAGKKQEYKAAILPLSKDASGKTRFDSNAGILGTIKRAITLPGDVYTGKVDPKSDEAIARSMDLAGIASPMGAATRATGQILPGMKPQLVPDTSIPKPTAEALAAAGSKGYEAVRNMGVDYRGESVSAVARALQQRLEGEGILAELAPKTHSLVRKLTDAPEGAIAPIAGIEAARRAAGYAAKDFANPTEQLAAKQLQRELDGFVSAADPATVVAGPAAQAARELAAARGNTAAAKRSDRITGLDDAAELRAAAANSGQNLDNAIRTRAAGVVLDPKKAAGYNAEEIAALRGVAEGTLGRNAARYIGNLLGGGGGLGQAMTTLGIGGAGAAALGPVGVMLGAAVPVTGMASKAIGNKLTSRALGKVDEMVRARSPLHEEAIASAPKVLSSEVTLTDRVLRAILAAQSANPEMTPDEKQRLVIRAIRSEPAQ